MSSSLSMDPIMIIPPGLMEEADIKLLLDNSICVVVVAKDPAQVRFMDPLPAISSRTDIENAAIQLSRKILNPATWSDSTHTKQFSDMFVKLLIEGTPLDPRPSQREQEKEHSWSVRRDEIARIAREEVRAERVAAKASEAAKKTKTA